MPWCTGILTQVAFVRPISFKRFRRKRDFSFVPHCAATLTTYERTSHGTAPVGQCTDRWPPTGLRCHRATDQSASGTCTGRCLSPVYPSAEPWKTREAGLYSSSGQDHRHVLGILMIPRRGCQVNCRWMRVLDRVYHYITCLWNQLYHTETYMRHNYSRTQSHIA